MEIILNFAKDYYIVLLVISGILILSLIGYLSDILTSKDVKIKKNNDNENITINMNNQ